MKLSSAAKHFDRVKLYDAYTGVLAVVGQFDVFDDSRRDAYGVERRILSTAPDLEIPLRRALTEPQTGDTWLVGVGMPDYFKGEVIRQKYVIHRADDLGYLRTPGELLSGAAGIRAYTNAAWIKDAKQLEESSNAPGMYSVFLSRTETALLNSVITTEGKHLWVRGMYETSGDFFVAETEDITDAVGSVQYETHTYNPTLDSTSPTTANIPALTMRWQALYENSSDAAVRVERGDRVCVVRKADVPTPKAGDIVRGKYAWSVHSAEDRGDVWALQVRVA